MEAREVPLDDFWAFPTGKEYNLESYEREFNKWVHTQVESCVIVTPGEDGPAQGLMLLHTKKGVDGDEFVAKLVKSWGYETRYSLVTHDDFGDDQTIVICYFDW